MGTKADHFMNTPPTHPRLLLLLACGSYALRSYSPLTSTPSSRSGRGAMGCPPICDRPDQLRRAGHRRLGPALLDERARHLHERRDIAVRLQVQRQWRVLLPTTRPIPGKERIAGAIWSKALLNAWAKEESCDKGSQAVCCLAAVETYHK